MEVERRGIGKALVLGDGSRYFASVGKKWTRHERTMGRQPPIKLDRILEQAPLDLIRDPETGLALLAKCPPAETPEQERERQFWQLQFTAWRDLLAGDTLAVSRAVIDCALFDRPPPFWLQKASVSRDMQCMPDGEKRARRDMNKHWLRWKAVKLVQGRHPNDPRNFKKKVLPDDVWEEAAKLVAGTDPEATAETVRKSYALIKRAGGARTTLPSYKREVGGRYRHRQHKKILG